MRQSNILMSDVEVALDDTGAGTWIRVPSAWCLGDASDIHFTHYDSVCGHFLFTIRMCAPWKKTFREFEARLSIFVKSVLKSYGTLWDDGSLPFSLRSLTINIPFYFRRYFLLIIKNFTKTRVLNYFSKRKISCFSNADFTDSQRSKLIKKL